jgi:DNA-binding transcriptional MocR family regulator
MSTLESINFTRGVPANESFPLEEMRDAAIAVLKDHGAAVMQYGPAAGFGPLREWIAGWQGVEPGQVLTGNGSLELVEFLCRHMIKPGDVVFTESPTYDRSILIFKRHGAEIVGIPLENDGPNIEALAAALQKRVPKFFYIIADFQNPAGATCSLTKRREIADLARRHNFLILEDAPYRMLRYGGVEEPTIRSLAPELTLHMSSFTKLIAPGVRVGFMLGEASRIAPVAKVAEDTYISPGYFAHGVTWEWCRRGLLPPQIERLKALYAPRLKACLDAIERHMPDARATRPEGGFFISLTLPPGTSTTDVRNAAAKRSLNLADGLAFFPNGGGERFLRLPFCALSPEQIEEGVRRLAESVKEVRR